MELFSHSASFNINYLDLDNTLIVKANSLHDCKKNSSLNAERK